VSHRRALAATFGALAASALLPAGADAHGLVGRADLPIPSWLFAWAAAIVLVVSFVALAALWKTPRLEHADRRALFEMPRFVDVVYGAVGVLLFVVVLYAGFVGSKTPTDNLAPTFIYVLFWVGLVVVSLLFGDVFRVFNPWLATARGVAWVSEKARGRPLRAPLTYPEWLGRWPAVAGIFGFAWLELAYQNKADPRVLAILAVAYAALQLAGMALFGIERWSRDGDAFGVYFNLFSRLSVFERRKGTVEVRPPLSGATALPIAAGSVALLCVAIGSTTFDGFSNGPLWAELAPSLQGIFTTRGSGLATATQWAATIGLVACIAAVSCLYWLGIRGMRTVGEHYPTRELAARFVHSLIPIAFAYALAHYFSFLVFQGQALGHLALHPLGTGAGSSNSINYNLLSGTAVWYVQVAALVCGHVAGLVLAHDRALVVYRDLQMATRSQYWMLAVMVGFTSLGLWLLASVNT
jgi:hypothetical protein